MIFFRITSDVIQNTSDVISNYVGGSRDVFKVC